MIGQRFRIDHGTILRLAAGHLFRREADALHQVGVLQQRSAVSRRVNARHLPQTLHAVEQPIPNAVVFLQPRRTHLDGRLPQSAAQQEIEHAVEASALTDKCLERESLHNVLFDARAVLLPNSEITAIAGGFDAGKRYACHPFYFWHRES